MFRLVIRWRKCCGRQFRFCVYLYFQIHLFNLSSLTKNGPLIKFKFGWCMFSQTLSLFPTELNDMYVSKLFDLFLQFFRFFEKHRKIIWLFFETLYITTYMLPSETQFENSFRWVTIKKLWTLFFGSQTFWAESWNIEILKFSFFQDNRFSCKLPAWVSLSRLHWTVSF